MGIGRFAKDLRDFGGMWYIWLGFGRFGWDVVKICMGFGRFVWDFGNLAGICEVSLGYGKFGW